MISVVPETEPAKFVAALPTGHMHTPLVFLDVAFAFGTGLSV